MYVMSSRFEGLPMVLIEAQECGLPIVSFDCPEGPSEIIHNGEDGFLVPLADTDALAEKIITLAKNEEMRKEFGKNAKINCQRFSPEKVGKVWMDLINNLTADKENKK
jgi:glycosyltransferase involved in cell wall biosynthesis